MKHTVDMNTLVRGNTSLHVGEIVTVVALEFVANAFANRSLFANAAMALKISL